MTSLQLVIIRYVRSVASAASLLAQPGLLVPFALLSLVELAALAVYLGFTNPLVSDFAAPTVTALFGEDAVHYPAHALRVPEVLEWIRCAAAVVAGTIFFPWGVASLCRRLGESSKPPRRGTGRVLRRAPWVVLVVAVVSLAVVGLQRGVGLLAEVPIVGRFQPVWMVVVFVSRPLFLGFLALVLVEIVSLEHSGARALRAGVSFASRTLASGVMVALSAAVILSPFHVLMAMGGAFVDAGSPEIVSLVAVGAVLVDVPVRFMLFASAVSMRLGRGIEQP